MTKTTSFRLSDETDRQLAYLGRLYGNRTTALTVCIETTYNAKRSNMHVTAAQLIRDYVGPEWLVEPVGEPSGQEDIDAINGANIRVMDRTIMGWGDYNAIVRVVDAATPELDTCYLAKITECASETTYNAKRSNMDWTQRVQELQQLVVDTWMNVHYTLRDAVRDDMNTEAYTDFLAQEAADDITDADELRVIHAKAEQIVEDAATQLAS